MHGGSDYNGSCCIADVGNVLFRADPVPGQVHAYGDQRGCLCPVCVIMRTTRPDNDRTRGMSEVYICHGFYLLHTKALPGGGGDVGVYVYTVYIYI